ncbi:metal-dependent hydrolase [Rubrobacter aplysinae]|uniref:metal-dependent hydrolase n=1 Tax=Rubrobacter aplysinae TaxID=909625 RepID=UPI00069CE6D7|nr:metal-dependent hydrolase [Rubrobacter aplysinae]
METYAHAFFTWALAKHGLGAGRPAAISGAVGSVIPDLPSFAGAAYFTGAGYFREGWSAMGSEEMLDAIYFTGPFGGTGSALHSLVLPAALLALYALLRLVTSDTVDARHVLLWFLVGWAGHTVADFLTHVNDTRPLFWPISGWEWSSPVSYYDDDYYGRQFFAIEHGAIIVTMVLLLFKRLRRRKGGVEPDG